jgi:hypothetical protein
LLYADPVRIVQQDQRRKTIVRLAAFARRPHLFKLAYQDHIALKDPLRFNHVQPENFARIHQPLLVADKTSIALRGRLPRRRADLIV